MRLIQALARTFGVPPAYFFDRILLDDQGDMASASEAYQSAIDSGHPQAAPAAAANLRALLTEQTAQARTSATLYEAGQVWRGTIAMGTPDAVYRDGQVWRGTIAMGTPDAVFQGEDDGPAAAAALILGVI